jgi:hypothetical protein
LQAGQRKGFVIDAARMPFNSSSWIQLGQISPSPADEEETFNRARLAVGPEGNAVAVWHFASSTKGEFGQSANYPVDAAHFNSFITLGNDVSEIDVAIGGNGDAIAVADSNNAIASRYLLFGTNEWSNPAVLATGTLLSSARVGADAQGNAVAIWSNLVNLQSSTFSNATKTWSSPITIPKDSATNTVGNPQIAVDPKGNAVAIWRGNVFGSQPQRHLIQVATLKAGTNEWTGLTVLSDINQDANHPHIAIDANSNAVAVWQQSNGTSTEIRTSIGTNLFP